MGLHPLPSPEVRELASGGFSFHSELHAPGLPLTNTASAAGGFGRLTSLQRKNLGVIRKFFLGTAK